MDRENGAHLLSFPKQQILLPTRQNRQLITPCPPPKKQHKQKQNKKTQNTTLIISFNCSVCSQWQINYSTSFEGTQSQFWQGMEKGVIASFLLEITTLHTDYLPEAPVGGLLSDQQIFDTVSFPCLFHLRHTRTPEQHLLLTSCTKRLQHRKSSVFVLFDLFVSIASINIISSLACVCVYVWKSNRQTVPGHFERRQWKNWPNSALSYFLQYLPDIKQSLETL